MCECDCSDRWALIALHSWLAAFEEHTHPCTEHQQGKADMARQTSAEIRHLRNAAPEVPEVILGLIGVS